MNGTATLGHTPSAVESATGTARKPNPAAPKDLTLPQCQA